MGLQGRYTTFLYVCAHPSSLSPCHTRKQYRAARIPADVSIRLRVSLLCYIDRMASPVGRSASRGV